jgi:DNA polymerase/3'-5' exonuclease PolX
MTSVSDFNAISPKKLKLAFASDAANKICLLLRSACEEIVIAGSVRRGKADVKDVELVAVPLAAAESKDLFSASMDDLAAPPPDPFKQKANCLDQRIDRLIAERTLELATDLKRNGKRYKRLRFCGVPIDLFIVERDSFGYQLAIRTGPMAFSKQLVTSEHFSTAERDRVCSPMVCELARGACTAVPRELLSGPRRISFA